MKIISKPLILSLSAFTLASINIQTAEASSSYTGSSELTFTITSIDNLSNPGTGYGNDLNYSGSLELDPFSGSIINGTGTVVPSLSDSSIPSTPTIMPFNFSFNQSMQIDGNISDGSIDAYYLDELSVLMENTSADTYQINYTVNYLLSVVTSGEFAEATVSITADNLGIPGGYAEAYSNSQISNSDSFGDTPALSLTLIGGGSAELYSGFEFSGYTEASSPVPLPASAWLYLTGLVATFRLKKQKLRK